MLQQKTREIISFPLAHFLEGRTHQAVTVRCYLPGGVGPSLFKPPGDSINNLRGYEGGHKPIRKHMTLGYLLAVESVCKGPEAFAQGFSYIRSHLCHKPGTSPLAKQRSIKSLVLLKMLENLY